MKAVSKVTGCPGGGPSWPQAAGVEGPSGKPVNTGWPRKLPS